MASQHVDLDVAPWTSGVPFYGPGAVFEGRDIVQIKLLSDRRREGGGIAWLNKFSPPPGKLIKIVAKALGRACVQSQIWPSHQVGRARSRLRRLYAEPRGAAAQCLYRQRKHQLGDLSRRTRRDCLAGGRRHRRLRAEDFTRIAQSQLESGWPQPMSQFFCEPSPIGVSRDEERVTCGSPRTGRYDALCARGLISDLDKGQRPDRVAIYQ